MRDAHLVTPASVFSLSLFGALLQLLESLGLVASRGDALTFQLV
jgi:hypothetical protein